MEIFSQKRLDEFKKELEEESTDNILAILTAIQTLEQTVQQELNKRID